MNFKNRDCSQKDFINKMKMIKNYMKLNSILIWILNKNQHSLLLIPLIFDLN